MKHKFAAQLYTVRSEVEKDFPGALRRLKEMGWPAVQMGELYGYSAEEIASSLKGNGLKVAGMHVSLERLQNELDAVLEEARLFQTRDIVLPYITEELRNENGYRMLHHFLIEIANKIQNGGYRLSYHNHDFEFVTIINGKSALEYLIEPASDHPILAELDVYWLKKGGHDPLTFIRPYSNRMPLIHLKDMTNDDQQYFAEIGTGVIDFAPILTWGEENGVEWYVVEQDFCPGDAMESLQISLTNLHKLADQLIRV